jgi:hypothetical protein
MCINKAVNYTLEITNGDEFLQASTNEAKNCLVREENCTTYVTLNVDEENNTVSMIYRDENNNVLCEEVNKIPTN